MEQQVRRLIGLRLKAARTQSGFTQQQVATDFVRSRQAVSSWEQGKTLPDVLELRALCLLYGISSDRILMGVDDSEEEGRELLGRLKGVSRPDFEPSVLDD